MDDRIRGDVGDQVVADERDPRLLVDEDRVGRAVPTSIIDRELMTSEFDHVAGLEPAVDLH